MKKSRIVQDLAFFTIILTIFSLLSGESLAARNSSEHENDLNLYPRENALSSYKNQTADVGEVSSSKFNVTQEQKNLSAKSRNKVSEYKQERKQFEEQLQFYKQEYRESKGDFLKIRNRIRTEELDPNSDEALNATKLYLNSSINYMIAHLSNVKSNMVYSNGNGTAERITLLDEIIKSLGAEKTNISNASNQEDLLVVVKSVRGVWNNAEKTSLEGAGQTVSEKIGEFLEKSQTLSEKLDVKIENLNESGADTSGLKTELASYVSYLESAQEKKVKADSLYSGENVTLEDMKTANNYLRDSLNDINKANNILREIFGELKDYEIKMEKGTGTGGTGTGNGTEVKNQMEFK